MNDFNDYVMAEFQSGIRLCKAPFASLIKEGDLIEVSGLYGKGKVMAVETTSTNDRMLNLLTKINSPATGIYKVSAIYSKKFVEWKDEDEND